MEESGLLKSVCLRKNGRVVTITPSHGLSTSCPELDKKVDLPHDQMVLSFPRKYSAPVVGETKNLLLSSCTSLTNLRTPCPEATPSPPPPRINQPPREKLRKHVTKSLLPNKPLFHMKKQKAPPRLNAKEVEKLTPMKSRRPPELDLSVSNLEEMKKPPRNRKLSCDLPSLSPSPNKNRGRKLSCDLTTPYSQSTKQSHKSFLFSFSKIFSGGRRGSKPVIVKEGGYMSDESADSAGASPVCVVVSSTGDGRRRKGVIELETVDGPSGGKNKLSPYNKLLAKSMELVSDVCVGGWVELCVCV